MSNTKTELLDNIIKFNEDLYSFISYLTEFMKSDYYNNLPCKSKIYVSRLYRELQSTQTRSAIVTEDISSYPDDPEEDSSDSVD